MKHLCDGLRWTIAACGAVVLFALTQTADAQGTTMTYQGRLDDFGVPANGTYDMTFAVFDAAAAGSQTGPTLTNSPVAVSNGLFTVTLDFGAGVFTGGSRWLEIGTVTNGGGAFEMLAQRQPITATPYAIHAGTAATVGGGAAVTLLNGLQDSVTLAAGSNVTITPSGNTLTIASAGVGGSGIWNLNGANTYFNTGNVGIGSISPLERLVIAGVSSFNNGLKVTGNTTGGTGIAIENTASGGHKYDLLSGGSGTGVGAGGFGIWDETAGSYRLGISSNGNVGLGNTTPAHRLGIGNSLPAWTSAGWGGAIELWSAAAIGWRANAGGQRFGMGSSGGGLYFFRTASDPGTVGSAANYDMIISDAGRVGIGTITPASKLTVRTTGAFSAYGIEHTDGDVRLSTYLDAGYGAWLGTRSAHGLNFYVNDGLPSMGLDTSGNVVMTPNGGASGYGSTIFGAPNGESGLSIRGYSVSPNRADLRFNGSSVKLVAGPGAGPPSSLNGIAVTTSGNVGIGTDAPLAKLDVRGTTRTCILTIVGGCDLAEPFPMDASDAPKGSVMVIDDENPGHLKLSDRAYDTRVAGILSGANGINPGITLQQEGVLDQGQNVALSGRVYVQADATFGAIKPGDLLTTSATPGHAMKVRHHTKAQGAILGKAMSTLKEGKGMVLVLVTLQ